MAVLLASSATASVSAQFGKQALDSISLAGFTASFTASESKPGRQVVD